MLVLYKRMASTTTDKGQYIEEFNKESLFFGNPKENKIDNITYLRIPIFRVLITHPRGRKTHINYFHSL